MKKLNYLEGLRGIAALMVVLYHFFAIFYPVITTGPSTGPSHAKLLERLFYGLPLGFIQNGSFAVVIFFLLSGFVLSYNYFSKKSNKQLINQSLKRYIRLAIPVFVSVMVGYTLLYLGLFRNQEVAILTGSIHFAPLWNFEPNLAVALYTGIIGVFTSGTVEYNPVLWTMSIELVGSFLVFLFLALFGKYSHRWIFYAFALIFTWNQFFGAFILGIIICDMYTSPVFNRIQEILKRPSSVLLLFMLVVLGGSVPAFSADLGMVKYSQIFTPYVSPESASFVRHCIAAIAILLLVLTVKRLQLILGSRLFTFFGKISFGVYVLHYFVYATITSYIFLRLYQRMPYWGVTLLCFIISVPIIILISAAWTHLVDRRAIFLSRQFAKRFTD